MDAVNDLPEQSCGDMREEIACTRSDLAGKLDALEDRVMGTVQSAQETVEDSVQIAKDTVASVKRTFDIKHHVEQHPWAMVGGCFLAGLALNAVFQRGRQQPRLTSDGLPGAETVASADPARAAEPRRNGRVAASLAQYQSQRPSRPGLLDLFHDEIVKVEAMAIGYVMGLARDAIKDAAPQWAHQIEGLMDSVTTKLGGEPAQQHSS